MYNRYTGKDYNLGDDTLKRILALFLAAVCSLSMTGCFGVENQSSVESSVLQAPSEQSVQVQTSKDISDESTFEIRYLDVGQADAALVLCDGQSLLVDGGNVADSSLIVAVLKKLDITHLDYIINSHAHEDHVGGLAGALNACTVGQVMCPVTSYDSKAFSSFTKYTEAQGKGIQIPKPGDTFELGSSTVKILGPVQDYSETNNTSIVLRIDYGQTSFLFTGDMERNAEQDLLEYWGEDEFNATVLKVGHHGSETSTSYTFLRAVMPSYGVISVGKGNSYGHPNEATLSRLRDAEVNVYRTDIQGDIIATSDGETVTFTVSKNELIETNPTIKNSEDTEIEYIGNLNSHKFHLPTCHTLPADKNRTYFNSREEAIGAGYSPCGNCNP